METKHTEPQQVKPKEEPKKAKEADKKNSSNNNSATGKKPGTN